MITVTFVWYPFMPIACEGNDDDGMSKTFSLKFANEDTIDHLIAIVEKRYGGYVQVWAIEK